MFEVVGDEQIVHATSETLTSYAVRWFKIEDLAAAVNFKINVPLTSPTVDVESLKISVYPNPASEIVIVKLSDAASSVSTLILTDLLGKTVLKQVIISTETELDISAIPSGIYFVSIYRENEAVAKSRIVINR